MPKRLVISDAMRFLIEACRSSDQRCIFFPYEQKGVSLGGKTRTPQWVTCHEINGTPPPDMVPVNTCGVVGCINGRHYKWGSFHDMLASRRFKERRGSDNPNAKLTEDQVARWKAKDWGNGAEKGPESRKAGISIKTLNMILDGKAWQHVEPNAHAGLDGDEF